MHCRCAGVTKQVEKIRAGGLLPQALAQRAVIEEQPRIEIVLQVDQKPRPALAHTE